MHDDQNPAKIECNVTPARHKRHEQRYERTTEMKAFFFWRLVLPGIALFALTDSGTARAEEYSAYLMVYFGPEEKLYYAYSHDALTWTALNRGEPVWSPDFVRDPFINRVGDTFHLVHTTGWTGDTIGHWESSDLIRWSGGEIQVVDEAKEKCWAPEFFYCEEENVFYVYWASLYEGRHHAMHYLKTRDWKNIKPEASSLYFDVGIHNIDLTIVKHNGIYYGFHKPGGVEDKMGNRLSTATSLDPNQDSFAKNGHGKIVFHDETNPTEGPAVVKIIGQQRWYIYGDPFHAPLEAWETTDFINYKKVVVQAPENAKHGSMIPITTDELDALLIEYPVD